MCGLSMASPGMMSGISTFLSMFKHTSSFIGILPCLHSVLLCDTIITLQDTVPSFNKRCWRSLTEIYVWNCLVFIVVKQLNATGMLKWKQNCQNISHHYSLFSTKHFIKRMYLWELYFILRYRLPRAWIEKSYGRCASKDSCGHFYTGYYTENEATISFKFITEICGHLHWLLTEFEPMISLKFITEILWAFILNINRIRTNDQLEVHQ